MKTGSFCPFWPSRFFWAVFSSAWHCLEIRMLAKFYKSNLIGVRRVTFTTKLYRLAAWRVLSLEPSFQVNSRIKDVVGRSSLWIWSFWLAHSSHLFQICGQFPYRGSYSALLQLLKSMQTRSIWMKWCRWKLLRNLDQQSILESWQAS